MTATPVEPHKRVPAVSVGFESAAKRLDGEEQERRDFVARELAFGVDYLDDVCRGILPRDLILVGAYTGVGKTALAAIVSFGNVLRGKAVYYFALEAEEREIERRLKYTWLVNRAAKNHLPGWADMNYPDWYRGKFPHVDQEYGEIADEVIATKFGTLHTYYRGTNFDIGDIEQQFKAIATKADLIVLDHLHYVDTGDEGNENAAVKRIVKKIRDVSLCIGVPVIVVAHLRKKNRGQPRIVPDLDDFHGSSDITKIATKVILMAKATDKPSEFKAVSNTYMSVPKDRMAGGTQIVGLLGFDLRTSTYNQGYSLGRLSIGGDTVEPMDFNDYPKWARSA